MDELEILKKAGLNEGQAKVYYALLTNGEMTPAQMAEKAKETRENCYLIAKKLEEMELIQKTSAKKATYRVLNPSNLEILAEKRRKIVQKNEKLLKDNISNLLNIFYANNEMPGSRSLEGLDGIKEVYQDMLRVGKDVYLLRTKADDALGGDYVAGSFLKKYRDSLVNSEIQTYALTPYSKTALDYVKNGRDRKIHLHRTWMPADAYTAPVAVQVYGDKASFIAFGEMPMATIITSPLIAEAVRQMIKIMIDFYQQNFQQEW